MSNSYVTRPSDQSQLSAVRHNRTTAEQLGNAYFETDTCKMWGVDEKSYHHDRKTGLVQSELTFILSVKDHRGRLNRDEMRAVARREINKLVAGRDGQWIGRHIPAVFADGEDHEICSTEIWLMSRTQWCVTVHVEARLEVETDPAGYWEYATSRGVRTGVRY